ncbi:MAG: hypothetical protein ACOCYO_04090 [Bacteroidota bacterium]
MKIINLITFLFMIIMNFLANSLPLNNKTTGELSAQYPNLFVPAGITFSVWGIIYLLLFLFIIFQFFRTNKEWTGYTIYYFALSSIFNGLWIWAWHYEKVFLSVIIMTALLITLLMINARIRHLSSPFLKATFGIYLGWICIAIIANITAFLVDINWPGWGISDQWWAIIMILTGAAIVTFAVWRLHNPFLALVAIWAFAGIIINRMNDFPSVAYTAVTSIVILIFFTTVFSIRKGFL